MGKLRAAASIYHRLVHQSAEHRLLINQQNPNFRYSNRLSPGITTQSLHIYANLFHFLMYITCIFSYDLV